jgi:hypothetical protein
LTFSTWFNNSLAGFVSVMINDNAVYTVDASDFNGPNVWNPNTIQFTATTTITNIRLEFIFGLEDSVDRVDDVAVTTL